MHGVGASVVNALSEWLEVYVHNSRDGKLYYQKFANGGKAVEDLKMIGDTDKTGSEVIFKADPTIFTESTTYDYETLRDRIRQLAFLNKGLRIVLIDRRQDEEKKTVYYYEGGIKEYVAFINGVS